MTRNRERSASKGVPTIIVGVILLILVVGAYVAFLRPATTAAPSLAVPASGSPAVPSVPASASAAPAVSVAPTAAIAGTECHNAAFGVTVSYPKGWYAYATNHKPGCDYFNKKAAPVAGDDMPALISITGDSKSMATAVADYKAAGGKVLRDETTTVDGHTATLLEIDSTGDGVAPNGMHEYLYLIETGSTTLIISVQGIADPSLATADWPYDGYPDNTRVVDSIVKSLKFD
jgi:hypothetical protein